VTALSKQNGSVFTISYNVTLTPTLTITRPVFIGWYCGTMPGAPLL